MTETEWFVATDPQPMLEAVRYHRPSRRKLRLLACACVRLAWDRLGDERSRHAVEAAERYADGSASEQELEEAFVAGLAASGQELEEAFAADLAVARGAGVGTAGAAAAACQAARPGFAAAEAILRELPDYPFAQCRLLRDIYRNPFRPTRRIPPPVLSWNGGTVPKLAYAIYEERAFDRLPVLADALEDAGCNDTDILQHCRSGGEHTRGCWVVDLILVKV